MVGETKTQTQTQKYIHGGSDLKSPEEIQMALIQVNRFGVWI